MELKNSNFKKLNKNIDWGIESGDMYVLGSDFINELVRQQAENIDDMYCKFLIQNGYKIDKPYNIEQLKEIKKDLEKQDKFIDYLEYSEFSEDGSTLEHHLLPFFNSISHPLSQDMRENLIKDWKERNKRNN